MPKLIFTILITFLFNINNVEAQRIYQTSKQIEEVKMDGNLSEDVWSKLDEATDFTVFYPNYGDESKFKSVVKMFYDDEALYIGGILYDVQPDSVSYSLSQRDDKGNADWIGITIDPYASNVTAFDFFVTSAGVELDALESVSSKKPDYSWNAVWKSATQQRDDGWSFEMRIPFSAIRFPNVDVQNWNINLVREVRRNREKSFWNPVNPEIYGEITQSGKLVGVENIKSPLRLSLTPYVTGYIEKAQDDTWRSRVAGGMDLKYGINDAFTLDMTLIPDFGQTTSDNQVLNLSPFEVRFDERRPFFLEGIDLFGIGNVFYSRRVGAAPSNINGPYLDLNELIGEEVKENPLEASLINATKVSGRTSKGLGIGIFNALESRQNAIIIDSNGNERLFETNPLTNYNVFVISQNLKNNSTVSFLNTHVLRDKSARDANVSVFESNIYTSDSKFKVNTSLKVSSILEESEMEHGHSASLGFSKVGGDLNYSFNYSEISDSYNPNDLGFLSINNSRVYKAGLKFNDFSSGKIFLRKWSEFNITYSEIYKPQLFSSLVIDTDIKGTLKNFLWLGIEGEILPLGYVNHFESRTFGKKVINEPSYKMSGFISSDYSKRLAIDIRTSIRDYVESDRFDFSLSIAPRIRVSDRMLLEWKTSFEYYNEDYGYVRILDSNYYDQIVLGVRDREVIINSLKTEFIFNKRMGINVQLRHYWQQVEYSNFLQLLNEGIMINSFYDPINTDETSSHNTSYNAFTLDINYSWVFMPGSELRIVYKNNIFNSKSVLDNSYFNTFDSLFDQPQLNSISLKLLIYLDAVYLRKKNK